MMLKYAKKSFAIFAAIIVIVGIVIYTISAAIQDHEKNTATQKMQESENVQITISHCLEGAREGNVFCDPSKRTIQFNVKVPRQLKELNYISGKIVLFSKYFDPKDPVICIARIKINNARNIPEIIPILFKYPKDGKIWYLKLRELSVKECALILPSGKKIT